MATRDFCDRCDQEIKGDIFFDVSLIVSEECEVEYKTILDMQKTVGTHVRINIPIKHPMLCRKCAEVISRVIQNTEIPKHLQSSNAEVIRPEN